jgi:hypothetical protein
MAQGLHQKILNFKLKKMRSKYNLFNLEDLCRIDTSNGLIESTENLFLVPTFSLNLIKFEDSLE